MTPAADLRDALEYGDHARVLVLARRALVDVLASDDDPDVIATTAERLRALITHTEQVLIGHAFTMAARPTPPADDVHRCPRAHRAYLSSVAAARRAARHGSASRHPCSVASGIGTPDDAAHTRAVAYALTADNLWWFAAYLAEVAADDDTTAALVSVLQRLALVTTPATTHQRTHHRRQRTRSVWPPGRRELCLRMSAQAPPVVPTVSALERNRTDDALPPPP